MEHTLQRETQNDCYLFFSVTTDIGNKAKMENIKSL